MLFLLNRDWNSGGTQLVGVSRSESPWRSETCSSPPLHLQLLRTRGLLLDGVLP
jgi:hypothetical protein